MKNTLFFLFLLATLTACPTTGKAQVQEIKFFTFAWNIRFFPNGEVWAQYGSSADDCLYLKAGSVDFAALLKTLKTAQRKTTEGPGRFQIGVRHKGQMEVTSFSLQNDFPIVHLLATLDDKWTGWNGEPIGWTAWSGETIKESRMESIKRRHPMIPFTK